MPTPQALVDHALEVSSADSCVVLLQHSSSANLRWANNTLTTNGMMTTAQLTVISIVDGARGQSSGVVTESASTLAQVAELVGRADDAARQAAPADDAAELTAGAESGDWDQPEALTSTDVFGDFAKDLGAAFGRAASAHQLLYGYVEHDLATTYLATSTGLRLRHEQPTGHVGITAKPTDLSASAWVGQATDDFSDVDVGALDAELVRRLGWGRNRFELPARRYQTLLPPAAVADLVLYAYFVASGRDAHEGQTVFSRPGGGTRIGEQIAKSSVRLYSDPGAGGVAAIPFVTAAESSSTTSVFDNGLRLPAADWIDGGTLAALATSRHTAEITGLPFTPLVDNLMLNIKDGSGVIDDLVARSTEPTLLLTCLWYIRQVDPQTLLLTGLTRDGVYLVEGGEVVGAVNNFRFNESPIDLLNRFTDAGGAVRSFSREWGDWFPRTITPALRVPDFNMSSVSQAS